MRYLQYYLVVILLFLLVINGIEVSAMDTGFSIEELSGKDRSTFISNVDISMLKGKPQDRAIQCFDVSEKGMIAIGQESTDRKEICVYSSDGKFQYGYTFICGQSFGVEWAGENINIFFVRSDVIVTVNQKGEIIDIAKVQNTIENNTYENYILYSTERTLGNTRYKIRNDMGILNAFSPSYSQLISINAIGEETILYDVNSIQFAKTMTVCILVVLICLLAVAAIVRQFIRLKHK